MKNVKFIVVALVKHFEIIDGKVSIRTTEPIVLDNLHAPHNSAQTSLADIADANLDCRKDDGEGHHFTSLYEDADHCWFAYHTPKGITEEHFYLTITGRDE